MHPLSYRRPRAARILVSLFSAGFACSFARADFLATDNFADRVLRYSDAGSLRGNFIQPGAGGLNSPFSMAFGPDGNLYVGGGGGNQIKVFSASDGSYIRDVPDPGGGWWGLLFTPNGDLLAASSNNQLYRLNATTGAILAQVSIGSLPGKMIMAPDGRALIGAGTGNVIRAWDLNTGGLTTFAQDARLNAPFGMDYGPDGMLYVVNDAGDQDVYRVNPLTGEVIGVFAMPDLMRAPADVLFVPGNRMYVSSAEGSDLSRFNATTGEYEGSFTAVGNNWDLIYLPEPGALGIVTCAAGLLLKKPPARTRSRG